MNFKDFGLDEEILNSASKLGFNEATKVQEKVIPLVLSKKDLIVMSQTGSGKTAAFGIPICNRIDVNMNEPQALILAPTRELAVQIKEDITNIGRFKRIRCAAIFGKQPISIQKTELKQRVNIIAGTPGRTLDHIDRGNLNLKFIKYLVIDEADELLNMGFIEEVKKILDKVPKNRITLLFSATMPNEIESLCKDYLNNPERIEIEPENKIVKAVDQIHIKVAANEKIKVLVGLIFTKNIDNAIIFCKTKENVNILNEELLKRKFSSRALHGAMLQKDRLETMKSFKKGEFNILVSTDVAARGIDIENLSYIINFDVPVEKESYVHRIGRTGRAGKKGRAITLVSKEEMRMFKEIEDYISQDIKEEFPPSAADIKKSKENYNVTSVIKEEKGANLNKDITKLYINLGKKKKARPGDIVGALSNIEGVTAESIGIIDIRDNFTYVDILDGKGEIILKALETMTIKGKKVKVEKAN